MRRLQSDFKRTWNPAGSGDTGLNYGRTVELHCDTGEFYIKSVGKPLKII